MCFARLLIIPLVAHMQSNSAALSDRLGSVPPCAGHREAKQPNKWVTHCSHIFWLWRNSKTFQFSAIDITFVHCLLS
uniref:LD16711p n=1 Tax=Drosophila melanogaster TaxID=7227 RepID=Q95RQ0_DROME|nr:LD16711p [Drosophila melanogaster]